MRVLPEGLSRGLDIRFETPVRSVGKDGRTWVVDTETETLRTDSVVIATPASAAAAILKDAFPDVAALLANAVYSPVVVVAAAVDDEAFPRPLKGFGFLIPRTEGLYTLGTQFNSCLFRGRAPEGKQLLTSFIGGALLPEVLDWTDDRIRNVVSEEVERVLSLPSGAMRPVALFRYERAIPQYGLGHPSWKSAVERSLERTPGLFLGGNYLEGISVPASIESGLAVGERVGNLMRRKR
jgi:oxygen-dependent protoporphyrinogen oxidase